MTKILSCVNAIVWGAPALVLILGVGLFLSIRLGWVQITLLPRAIRMLWQRLRPRKSSAGDGVSPFQALCTALAATVGTGNLVGVAGAICLGGPGAIFWMWVCGVLGMVTKYAEAVLAVRYRVRRPDGYAGGPMYVIRQALGRHWQWMAKCYCLLGLVAAFGVGNATQINAMVSGIRQVLGQCGMDSPGLSWVLGLALAVLVGRLLLGGAKPIGQVAQRLVPLAAGVYILMCLGVLTVRHRALPEAVGAILQGAWCPRAVTGGALGSAFQALRIGCSRGVFTNEAGMGTASIAHAGAEVDHPAQQGLMGILEVFLDTIVICTLTALVILVSGVPIPYGADVGGELTTLAFASVYGAGAAVAIAAELSCFALATVLGWGLYGGRCAEFLFGPKGWRGFALAQSVMVVAGAVLKTDIVWQISETVNGLMAIPNLITLAVLTPEVCRLTKDYKKTGVLLAGGGNYADFHQRKPLRAFSHEKVPSAGGGGKESGKEDLSPEHRSA